MSKRFSADPKAKTADRTLHGLRYKGHPTVATLSNNRGRLQGTGNVEVRCPLSPVSCNLINVPRPPQVKGSHRASVAFIKVDRIALQPTAHQFTEQAVRQQAEA